MKVRNIAFFGVMASILGVGYANADTPATVIASKAYADTKAAKVTPASDSSANKLVTVNTEGIVTGYKAAGTAASANINANGTLSTTSTTTVPSEKVVAAAIGSASTAVNGAYGDNVLDTAGVAAAGSLAKVGAINATIATQGTATADWKDVTDDTKGNSVNLLTAKTKQDLYVPTISAVEKRLEKKQDNLTFDSSPTSGSNNPVKSGGVYTALAAKAAKVSPASDSNANNLVTVNTEGIVTGYKAAGAAATMGVNANGTLSTSSTTTVPSEKVVAAAITAAAPATEADSVVTSANTTKLPTVGGVQKGIAKQGTATVSWKNVAENTEGAGANLYASKTKQDEYLPTVKAVETRITEESSALTNAINGKQDKLGGSSNGGKAVIASSTAGNVNYRTISTAKPTSTTSTDLVTAGAVATGLADKVTANSAITASGSTNKFVQYDTKGLVTAGVDAKYKYIDNALYDINTAAAATCSTTNPCVLTYIGSNKFKWTNMDIDSLPVNSETGTN